MIAVERREPQKEYVDRLVARHRAQLIDVAITTVSASEALPVSKSFPMTTEQFTLRIKSVGLNDLTLLQGPAVWGLSHWGHSIYPPQSFGEDRLKIWKALFPKISAEYPVAIKGNLVSPRELSKWRNRWCDVHTLWTHIHYGREVFVTSNRKDFQRKQIELEKLGAGNILTPEEASNRFA